MGQTKERFLQQSQLEHKNAYKAATLAAWNSFKAGLAADQALFDAQQIRTRCLLFSSRVSCMEDGA